MIKIRLSDELIPFSDYRNYFIESDEDGNQLMQFEIPLNDMYYRLHPETMIEDDYGRWLIKKINQLSKSAAITCEPDMDDWHSLYHLKPAEDEHLQTKTIGNALNYLKPKGWTIANAGVCKIKRTLDLEKCTAYDLLMRAKTVYDVQYDIDTLGKVITIVDPYERIDLGVYITPELNQKSVNYKGDSSGFVTRLYCYGADDMTFADINNGKPYVENTAYNGKVICGSWSDGRYTNMESLLEDGKKKLAEMAIPTGAYTIDVVDLQGIDEKYRNLELRLRSKVHCMINPDMNIDIVHRIVKKRVYPDNPAANKITLSNQPRTLEKMWNALKENVQTVQKDGMRYETEVKQTNKEITEIAKKTDENTKGIQSVEQKLTPKQLLIEVSDSIKSGNKLDVTQVIIDLLGLTIKNGGIKIYNEKNELIFYVDEKTKELVMKGNIKGGSITGETTINVGTDLYVGNNIYLGDPEDGAYKKISLNNDTFILLSDYSFTFQKGSSCLIIADDGISTNKDTIFYKQISTYERALFYKGMNVIGNAVFENDLTVKGSKNRVVNTENYGKRKLNAVESAECYFTDEGQVTLDDKGIATINFDPIWLETVNTNKPYHVHLTPYCEVSSWIVEEFPDHCVIAGKPNTKVNWHISALQKDYDNARLEEYRKEGD